MDEKRTKQLGEIVDRHREILRQRDAEEAEEAQRMKKEKAQQEREEGEVLAKLLARSTSEIAHEEIGGVSLNISPPIVGFKRLSDGATVPTKAHATDSGFDLYAAEDVVIEPGETVIVPTGIAVRLPERMEAQVRPRSGVTAKTKLRVQLGTIDNGYSGEIGVIVDNIAMPELQLSTEYTDYTHVEKNKEWALMTLDGDYGRGENIYPENTYLIRKGDRIAQLVVQALPSVTAVEVFDVEETERGADGYGSSGV